MGVRVGVRSRCSRPFASLARLADTVGLGPEPTMRIDSARHLSESHGECFDFSRNTDQGLDQARLDVDIAFVLRQVPLPVRLVEDPPLLWQQSECMLQSLKYEVAMLGAIAVKAKSCERKSMSSIVGQVESTLEAQTRKLCILDAHCTGPHQPFELCRGRRFALELPDPDEVIQRLQCHP